MTTRLTAAHRRAQIIDTAQRLSYGGKLYDWSVQTVADRIGVSRATVCYYFASTKGLRGKVIFQAIRTGDDELLIQALVKSVPHAKNNPAALRENGRGDIYLWVTGQNGKEGR